MSSQTTKKPRKTARHIVWAGIGIISRSPDKSILVQELMGRITNHLPEDMCNALDEWNSDWKAQHGYRAFNPVSRADWLEREGGRWTLTPAGIAALEEFPDADSFFAAAKAATKENPKDHEPIPYLGEVLNSGSLPQMLYSMQTSTVEHLVGNIEQKTLALPDIQRPFVWKNTKVRDLLDSMFRGFPFGYILTWRNPVETNHRSIGGDSGSAHTPYNLVIDGQQRLTSLFAVMTGSEVLDRNFKQRKIQIAFHPIKGSFEVADAAIKKNPEWLPDISEVFTNQSGALSVLRTYLKKLQAHRSIEPSHERAAEQNIQRLNNLKNIQLNVLEISHAADEEQVAEIFVRINSKGQNLKQSDFILTLLAVFWEEGRNQLESFSRSCKVPCQGTTPSPFNQLIQPNPDDLIRVCVSLGHRRAKLSAAYQVLRGKDPSTGTFTDDARERSISILKEAQDFALSLDNWNEFIKVIQIAGYRRDSLISSMNSALMSYALFLIGKRDYGLDRTQLRRLIARWFTFLNITGRYSGSAESTMEEDLARLRDLEGGDAERFIRTLESVMNTELTSDFWSHTLPVRLETSSTRSLSPFFAAQCVLNAPALYSSLDVPTLLSPDRRATRSDLEIHHLYPKNWLKSQGINDRKLYNQIANQTLVEWEVNASISDQDPEVYAPEFEAKIPQDDHNRSLELNALPAEWWKLEYTEFVKQRRVLMASVLKGAFDRLDSVS